MKKAILVLAIVLSISSCQKQVNERILFSSSSLGNSDIYVMDSETLNSKQLTNSTFEEWGPTWITENEISFLRQKHDQILRYKLNLDTGEESQIQHPENCILDDKNMLYASNGFLQLYQCTSNIFLFDKKAGTTTNLTQNMNGYSKYPSWSFDGTQVIFTNNQSGTNDIFMMDLATKKITQVTDFPSNDERGEHSPDRKHIVFSSDKFETRNQDILLKNLETGTLENISNSKGTELIARWSVDGKHIYFGSNKDGNWEIYQYTLQDKSTKRMTTNAAFDGDPRVFKG
ncbi:dipeptidyl-peptidase 5 [Kordia sp. SMS9]|uniref:TolB family protein n=1 Tax=Kordia sp. SMS9 TaxID=2282170 RepID=UPI000E0DCA9D|nr:PD40 domain-containing protein [Kordia sp. SMS9]AXG67984.1 dipeptidyl-peptidase 5 [Kordia sp. SMS9]